MNDAIIGQAVVGFLAINAMRERPQVPAWLAAQTATQVYQQYATQTLDAQLIITMQMEIDQRLNTT